jgi:hypothetical protein
MREVGNNKKLHFLLYYLLKCFGECIDVAPPRNDNGEYGRQITQRIGSQNRIDFIIHVRAL